jgi:diguanylate cyclase (GGDEF)-like protein/PAS domain S-box-containing protein
MLDNELIGILITREQQIVWTNAATRRILACGEEVLEGQSVRTLYPDEASFQQVSEEAMSMLRAGGRYRSQLRARRRDGQPLWIDMHGTLMPGQPQEALWLLADITLLKDSELRAAHSAQHDPLTGLPNRLLLDDRLQQALTRAERSRESLAVCYLDLDGFKAVNDRLGHAAGDQLLIEMARRLQACVRAQDTVARLGGDEFVLLLPAPGEPAELEAVLARVSSALNRPVLLDGQSAEVSASVGVALYPQDGHQADALLAQADRAMYQAKRQGRQRVCYSGAALPAL